MSDACFTRTALYRKLRSRKNVPFVLEIVSLSDRSSAIRDIVLCSTTISRSPEGTTCSTACRPGGDDLEFRPGGTLRSCVVAPHIDADEDRSTSKQFSLDLLHLRPPCWVIHCSRRGKTLRSSAVVPRLDADEDRLTSN